MFLLTDLLIHQLTDLITRLVVMAGAASYLSAPGQIPACGIIALDSSEILASVKEKIWIVLPSLLFPTGRFVSVPIVLLARQMFPLQATYSVSSFLLCRVSWADLDPYKPSDALSFYRDDPFPHKVLFLMYVSNLYILDCWDVYPTVLFCII